MRLRASLTEYQKSGRRSCSTLAAQLVQFEHCAMKPCPKQNHSTTTQTAPVPSLNYLLTEYD
jgi:hypothetical protein